VTDNDEDRVVQLGSTGCLLVAIGLSLFLSVYGALSLWADYGW